MLPLPLPIDHWSQLYSVIKKFIWGRKRPQIKYATQQRTKASGGLAVPNPKNVSPIIPNEFPEDLVKPRGFCSLACCRRVNSFTNYITCILFWIDS
jgi:hypothetical protein